MSPAILLLSATISAPPTPVHDLKLPAGFTARLYADNPIAPDIYTMTIDDDGRVLVAGRGYVRVLVDDNGDGVADRAIDLIDGPKDGPMGLLAEGDSLFVVTGGGLQRYRGYNGKDKLKGPPETILALKTSGEHDAHVVRRGPDGWLYLLCGNSAGIRKQIITSDRSPVKEPIAGGLVRISPDFKTVEVVADGFRNPYSFDFNLDGEPFTYDSDNERCVGLPWYEGCRFYHIVPGGNYGWRSPQLSQTWRKPPYFPDVVAPICDTGRGSPTGVACYRHTAFPEQYRGGFFFADWTFGRIYYIALNAHRSSYSGEAEVFAQSTGTSGFAPTALAVHPQTGELFVSIGGRGTRGGVYRITFDKAGANPKPLPVAERSLDFDKEQAKQWLADCKSDDAQARRRALELIVRWWDKVTWGKPLNEAVKRNLTHDDRLIRRPAGQLGVQWFVDLGPLSAGRAKLALALAEVRKESRRPLSVALAVLDDDQANATDLVEALRLIQLVYGDLTRKDAGGTVWEGYTFRNAVPREELLRLHKSLTGLNDRFDKFPPVREVGLEMARVMAAIRPAFASEAARATLDRITEESPFADDFHYLTAFSAMTEGRALRSDARAASSLFALLAKMKRQNALTDRHWPIRLVEVVKRLSQKCPGFELQVTVHPSFGQPEHAVFAGEIRPRDTVARKFLAAAEKDKNYAWTPAVVELLASLPPKDTRPVLRKLWEQPELEDAVLRVLAIEPVTEDRLKFVAGLKSLDPDLARISADALNVLPVDAKSEVFVQAIKALRRFHDQKTDATVRAKLVDLLQKYSGEKIGTDTKAWAAWAVKSDPGIEKSLNASDGFDPTAWQNRLAGIDWSKGIAERGRVAFAKATCTACHDGGNAVGPSLLGISKRFSRNDLLTAILQPSKDVSARYRPTRITTSDEKSYTGIIIYEATDGVILQTGADTTVRIAGADIASKKSVEMSLMPAGLLDKLSDPEIADLLAYLSTLGEPKPK